MRRRKRFTVAITKALLDTHVFLWSAVEPERLSRTVRQLLKRIDVTLYLSVASVWEMSLKQHKGKLNNASDIVVDGQMKALSILPLPISLEHIRALSELPSTKGHKDPFDRLIAAQAMVENLLLITADPAFAGYPQVKIRW
jgi:PIN domain nuclease of toxin-antitoxin system